MLTASFSLKVKRCSSAPKNTQLKSMENSTKNINFSLLLKFRLKTASNQKNQPSLTSRRERRILPCSTYPTDEREVKGIHKEHPDHALLSISCKMQLYLSSPSQLGRKTQMPQFVPSRCHRALMHLQACNLSKAGTPF